MELPFIKKNKNRNQLIKVTLILIMMLILGSFLSISAVSVTNYIGCKTATKDYKIDREVKRTSSTQEHPWKSDPIIGNQQEKIEKFSDMLMKCQKHRQFNEKVLSSFFVTWLLGLPVFFLGAFLAIWAYVIKKYGLLIGGSIGIIPPILISITLSLLWPMVILVTLFLATFKMKCIENTVNGCFKSFRINALEKDKNL